MTSGRASDYLRVNSLHVLVVFVFLAWEAAHRSLAYAYSIKRILVGGMLAIAVRTDQARTNLIHILALNWHSVKTLTYVILFIIALQFRMTSQMKLGSWLRSIYVKVLGVLLVKLVLSLMLGRISLLLYLGRDGTDPRHATTKPDLV